MIVATLLLAIGVSAAMLALSTSSQASYKAERVQTAALLAQKQMTEIELQAAQNKLSGGDQTGDFGLQYPEYQWKESVEATNYPELFKVTLTVMWDLGHFPHSQAVFTTYLSNPQNATTQATQAQSNGTASSTTSTTTGATGGTAGRTGTQ
jgi:type II secretory pathway pseudopilin PulG